MLCAGEVVFTREEAVSLLVDAGYTEGSGAFQREFDRRYIPAESMATVSESQHVFLSAEERSELEALCSEERWLALFNHYELLRASSLITHDRAREILSQELEHIKHSDPNIKFHQFYLKVRRGRGLAHANALHAARQDWFAGGL